jgi:hypothetical protein
MPTPWTKGPPPCKGWWNASVERNPVARRWWNGEHWSRVVYLGFSDATTRLSKRTPATEVDVTLIEYRGQTAAEVRRRAKG